MYNVTAKSHIGPVGYAISVVIDESQVTKFLAKGILYEAQRIAASKAVKALGGGKRASLVYNDEAREAVEAALAEVFGEDADIECSEHVKGAAITKKFAVARGYLADKKGDEQGIADRAGFTGDIYDEDGDFSTEFLVAVENRIKKLAASL